LRATLVAWTLGALVASAGPVLARTGSISVLVFSPVSEQAAPTMSQPLWNKLIADYIGANVVPASAAPTVDACRKAGADYLVSAPFDLRPMLPGLANATGRVAARTHLVVTNCVTGSVLADRTVDLDSDPPSKANEGDFESVPETSWARSVAATLKRSPLVFERVAHVFAVMAPLALVDLRTGARPGDGLRDFARGDHSPRATPIILTVTQVFDRYLEVVYATTGDRPEIGDLVEPIPRTTPTPLP